MGTRRAVLRLLAAALEPVVMIASSRATLCSVLVPGRRAQQLAVALLVCASLRAGAGCRDGLALRDVNNHGARSDGGLGPDAAACGVGDDEKLARRAARIFNGTAAPVSPAQQRAVGAILFDWGSWTNGCTGTLVTDSVVLTAAHCVQDWHGTLAPGDLRFAMGRDSAQPEATLAVAEVHPHPGYLGEADHDVALLVLAQPASSTGLDVLPIAANTRTLDASFVSTWVQNVGYGSTETNEDNHVRFWTTEEVTQVLPGEFVVYGQGVSSVCYGDSGGPSLHLWGGAHLAVIGTVSWGDESCVDHDHFARADDNQAFMEPITGPSDPCLGIDALGRCDGDVAIWCENGVLWQECCAERATTCVQATAERAHCDGACAGLTWLGRCTDDDVAEWCEGGQVRRRRCVPCGQTCDWAGDALGFYCLDQ